MYDDWKIWRHNSFSVKQGSLLLKNANDKTPNSYYGPMFTVCFISQIIEHSYYAVDEKKKKTKAFYVLYTGFLVLCVFKNVMRCSRKLAKCCEKLVKTSQRDTFLFIENSDDKSRVSWQVIREIQKNQMQLVCKENQQLLAIM